MNLTLSVTATFLARSSHFKLQNFSWTLWVAQYHFIYSKCNCFAHVHFPISHSRLTKANAEKRFYVNQTSKSQQHDHLSLQHLSTNFLLLGSRLWFKIRDCHLSTHAKTLYTVYVINPNCYFRNYPRAATDRERYVKFCGFCFHKLLSSLIKLDVDSSYFKFILNGQLSRLPKFVTHKQWFSSIYSTKL